MRSLVAHRGCVLRVITPAGTPVSAETIIVSGGVINVLLVIALKAGGAVISYGYHDASWNRSERLALVNNLGARAGAVKVLRTNVDTTSESAGLAPLPAGGSSLLATGVSRLQPQRPPRA